jgi:hypothetical protein
LACLRVRNIDFARGRLEVVENLIEADGHLHEGSPKARRTSSVPLPRFLRPELAARIGGMDPDERVLARVGWRPDQRGESADGA